jgi:hypothetical protein
MAMKCFTSLSRHTVTLFALLTFFGLSADAAFGQSAVKLQGAGAIDLSTESTPTFALSGTASHLGRYTCYGEIEFHPGAKKGSMNGVGVAVFEAANGDLLVGVATCELDADGTGQIRFSWRDSVEFSDGTIVSSTGRFVSSRPPGALSPIRFQLNVVISIIAILIGP